MANIIKKVLNYRTSKKLRPSASNLEYGQISVQYNSEESRLYIKNTNNEISEFVDKSYIDSSVSGKQDTLESGVSIKTINGQSILGQGDITISGGSEASGTVTRIQTSSGLTGGPITESGTIGLSSNIIGTGTANSLSSIPVNNRVCVISASANGTISFSALPSEGFEVHLIIHNTGSSAISVALPSAGNYICTSDSIIYIESGKYGEVNVVTAGGIGYIRGVNSI